jgi:hypothetical protein
MVMVIAIQWSLVGSDLLISCWYASFESVMLAHLYIPATWPGIFVKDLPFRAYQVASHGVVKTANHVLACTLSVLGTIGER